MGRDLPSASLTGSGQGEQPEGSQHPGNRVLEGVSLSGQGNQREVARVIVACSPNLNFSKSRTVRLLLDQN